MGKKPILAWHVVPADMKLRHSGEQVFLNKTYKHNGKVRLCSDGYHASMRLMDALSFVGGDVAICRVECSGQIENGDDKLVCSVRKVVAILSPADTSRVLHEFALACATRALELFGGEVDGRSWEALSVKQAWLDGLASNEDLDAARDAARAAAWAAAWDAAWAAAWAAARDAEYQIICDELEARVLEAMFLEG